MGAGFPHWSDRFKAALRQQAGSFLDLCLPRLCAGCRRTWLLSHEGHWCEDCLDALPWIRSPRCPQCGRPFLKSPDSHDHPCGECLLSLYPFDTARSATIYAGVVRERIHQLKFGAQLHWVPPLVDLLVMALENEDFHPIELLLPVPLHVRRLRQRGFNQSALLAKELGKKMGVPVRFDVLHRRVWTEPQTRLKRQERLENVKEAFHVVRPSVAEGTAVLLLDDVFTTGSTINECARTLKDAGAAKVLALTVARALPYRRPDDGAFS